MVSWTSTLLDDGFARVRTGLMQEQAMKFADRISFIWQPDMSPGDELPEYTMKGEFIDKDLYSRLPTVVNSQYAFHIYDDMRTRDIEYKISDMTRELMEYITNGVYSSSLVNITTLAAYMPSPVDDFTSMRRLVVSVWIYTLREMEVDLGDIFDIFSNFEW